MLEVYDRSLQKVAVLQNARTIEETESLNAIGSLSFQLPGGDPKADYCRPFFYVRYDEGELYRIVGPSETVSTTDIKKYKCEHVIATLIDDVLFGAYTIGNLGTYTTDVIEWILSCLLYTSHLLGARGNAARYLRRDRLYGEGVTGTYR